MKFLNSFVFMIQNLRHIILVFAIAIVVLFGSYKAKAQKEELFEKKEFYAKLGDTLKYRLLSPENFDPLKKYPLVIFLHGAGERGNDNEMQLTNGVKNFATDVNREKHPCFVVAPQCAEGFRWVETDWKLTSHVMPATPSVYMIKTIALLDSMCKLSYIDTNRIYITGMSMGGFGTWDAISRWPHKFAAAIPVCGGADTSKASLINDIPIWVFHGALDKVVLTSRSRDMVAALKKAGGNPLYTEYPDMAHGIWAKTYANPELYEWLFKQSRSAE